MKKATGGSKYYEGKKAVVCHVPIDVYKSIEKICAEEHWSIEIVGRALICFALKKKPTRDELKAALPT